MSWVFSVLLFFAPLFSWGDSLYLDSPRLGVVDDFASSGRNCHWIFTDIAIIVQNNASRWSIGLRPIPLSEQSRIDGIVENPCVKAAASDDLKPDKRYWIGTCFYEAQHYEGPWGEIERMLAALTPSYTVDVRNEPLGAGARAVHGTLYCGENACFCSASGTYEIVAPPASAGIAEYLNRLADKDSIAVDRLCLGGILYLQGDFPLFFYVLEEG